MKNLENNKIYKAGQISLFFLIVLSFLIMIIRSISVSIGLKFSFLSSYLVWRFFDIGLISYEATPRLEMLIRLVVSCGICLLIYVICLIMSKKNLYYLAGALSLYVLDTAFFAYETIIQTDMTEILIEGLIFKLFIIAIMSIGIIYGYIGRRIETDAESGEHSPDMKFINKKYSSDLTGIKRKITFERKKSFINSYIYLQIIIDGKTKHYLKNGESFETEVDANQHIIMIVCHFENIEPITQKIPMGSDDNSYLLSIDRKFPFRKSIIINRAK